MERNIGMDLENVYFFNGSAYAGKSTMVKRLAEKYDGIACEENYHESLMGGLDWNELQHYLKWHRIWITLTVSLKK